MVKGTVVVEHFVNGVSIKRYEREVEIVTTGKNAILNVTFIGEPIVCCLDEEISIKGPLLDVPTALP